MFFTYAYPGGVACQLCLRQSSSASTAQGWLRGEYGIDVIYRLKYSWYCMSWLLADSHPKRDELLDKLERRCTIAPVASKKGRD